MCRLAHHIGPVTCRLVNEPDQAYAWWCTMPCLITHLQRGVPRHAELLMCSVVYRAIPDYSRAGWRATSPSTANHNAKVATRFVPQVSSGRQVVADVGDAGHTRVTNGCMHTCMQGGGGGACWCHQWLHACMHAWGGVLVGCTQWLQAGCKHTYIMIIFDLMCG